MSDTSPHSNIISKKLSRCSNHCTLLVFSQTAYSKTSASQNFSSFLKKFLQSEKNASGRYSNPQFGITDIIFPQGWHGTHIPSLIGLIVFMHAGNQRELAGNPFGQGQPTPLRPQIMLQIINNSALAKINSMSTKLKGGLSIFKNCKQLARNFTSMISGKTFNVITVECHLSSLMGSQGAAATTSIQSNFGNRSNNNILSLMSNSIIANGMMQTKPFEYNGSGRTYRLAIVVNNQLFSTNSNSTPQKNRRNKIYSIHRFNSKYLEIKIRRRHHFFLSPKIFQQQHNQQIDSFLIHFYKAGRN